MTDLEINLNSILNEKTTKIIPENIKEGVTIFGVTGTHEGGGDNTIKITNCSYLFHSGARLDYINELLSLCINVTNTEYMFRGCSGLKEIDLSNFDTSNVTNMGDMFNSCFGFTELDVSNFDTSNVTDMGSMFAGCSNLTELNVSNFDTSNVTDMGSMFQNCSDLTELDVSNFDTSNVTAMGSMFNGCTVLTELDLSNFDASKVNNIYNAFGNLKNIINLKFMKNLGKGYTQKTNNYNNYRLSLSNATKLTYESLMNVINNLHDLNLTYDVANGGTLYTQGLQLGSTLKAKLTAEEIAIATNKGWTVS